MSAYMIMKGQGYSLNSCIEMVLNRVEGDGRPINSDLRRDIKRALRDAYLETLDIPEEPMVTQDLDYYVSQARTAGFNDEAAQERGEAAYIMARRIAQAPEAVSHAVDLLEESFRLMVETYFLAMAPAEVQAQENEVVAMLAHRLYDRSLRGGAASLGGEDESAK